MWMEGISKQLTEGLLDDLIVLDTASKALTVKESAKTVEINPSKLDATVKRDQLRLALMATFPNYILDWRGKA